MSEVNEAINLKNKIRNHSHFSNCLKGTEKYYNFLNKEHTLESVNSAYTEILKEKKNLIKCKNTLKNKQSEYDKFKEKNLKELEIRKRKKNFELQIMEVKYRK